MLIGNKNTQKYFLDLLKRPDQLSHAYLFYGPEGVGKKTFALKIAEVLAGDLRNAPDIRIIQKGEEAIYISDIRELKNFAYLTSFGEFKVAVIDNAHNFTQEASNALLKVLEEPPGKTILFLISHLEKMLPATIISRCQLVRFKPIEKEKILEYLMTGRRLGKDAALNISDLANGSLAKGIKLAEELDSFSRNAAILERLKKESVLGRFEFAKKIAADSEKLKAIVSDWLTYSKANIKNLASPRLVRDIFYLNYILSQPQFNHRLALEAFLVKL